MTSALVKVLVFIVVSAFIGFYAAIHSGDE